MEGICLCTSWRLDSDGFIRSFLRCAFCRNKLVYFLFLRNSDLISLARDGAPDIGDNSKIIFLISRWKHIL